MSAEHESRLALFEGRQIRKAFHELAHMFEAEGEQ
jgi:hypothetical protein